MFKIYEESAVEKCPRWNIYTNRKQRLGLFYSPFFYSMNKLELEMCQAQVWLGV